MNSAKIQEKLSVFTTSEMYEMLIFMINKESQSGRISKIYQKLFDEITRQMTPSNFNELLYKIHNNMSIKNDFIKDKLKINLQDFDTSKVRNLYCEVFVLIR
jgi:hypothetical protein